MRLTKRAPDAGDSAAFSSDCAGGVYPSPILTAPRPRAGNAIRWAASQIIMMG